MEVQILRTLNFEINCTIPAELLESYSVAVGVFRDREVLFNTCYFIDLSLLTTNL